MWAQYNLSDPDNAKLIQATNSQRVADSTMADHGRGQIEFPALNPSGVGFTQVDITQVPPIFS